jgi:hypothetical protein
MACGNNVTFCHLVRHSISLTSLLAPVPAAVLKLPSHERPTSASFLPRHLKKTENGKGTTV